MSADVVPITTTSRERKKLPAPYSAEAEESLIGAAMLSQAALQVLAEQVDPEDFYTFKWQVVATHLKRMWRAGQKIDVVALADEIQRTGDLERIGGAQVLLDASAVTPSTTNAAEYARIILDYAARRRLMQASSEVFDAAQDFNLGVAEIMEKARSTFGSVDLPVIAGQPDPDVATFMEGPIEYDWLIHGLIEKGDRFILTAAEGSGKSTFWRQVAVCVAAGVHPFRHSDPAYRFMRPVRVLLVDLENSEMQIRRKMRMLVATVARLSKGNFDPSNLRIVPKTDGLDLLQRMDVLWLMERIEADAPELLIIGPVYKLHSGDPIDEGPARAVAAALDLIRARYGCAVMMEAHSPYATNDGKRVGRPYGASLWSRWPEFGFCLVRAGETEADGWTLEPWRGPRDEREWPDKLERGNLELQQQGKALPWAQPEGSWERRVDYLPPAPVEVPPPAPEVDDYEEEPWA